MAPPLHSLLTLFTALLLMQTLAEATTCRNCTFIHSRAVYYPNSDLQGTDRGACGFGLFGATLNDGDVSAASDLYRNGIGCGSCYQVRCTDAAYCSDGGVTVVITDSGASDHTDFILSRRAFRHLGNNEDSASSLLELGVLDIEYIRVSCSYPDRNLTIKIDENSDYPYYLAFLILYQQGDTDITTVQLCETENSECQLVDRSYGAVFSTAPSPRGPLTVRMLVSDGDGNETWVVPHNHIPANWKAGATYDTGLQLSI